MKSEENAVRVMKESTDEQLESKPTTLPSDIRNVFLLLGLSTIFFIVLVVAAAIGLRGSDQYWYTAEIEQLMAGAGNSGLVAFPFHAFNGLIPPPLNHHTVIHYLVLAVAGFTGPYFGWIAINTLATILSATLIGVTTARLSDVRTGVFAYILTLLTPMVFWVTAQPYMESSLAAITAAALFFALSKTNASPRWWSLLAVLVIGVYSRVSFVALLALVPLAYCCYANASLPKKAATTVAMIAVIIAALVLQTKLFPADPALSLTRYLNAKVPGISDNMHVLYSLHQEPIEVSKVVRKAYAGIVGQVLHIPLRLQLFYAPFNLMLLFTILACYHFRANKRLLVAVAAVGMMHLATVILRGNEFRFLHVVNPATTLGTALFFAVLFKSKRVWLSSCAAVLLGFIALNIVLTTQLRNDVKEEAALRTTLTTTFDNFLAPTDSLILATRSFLEEDLLLGYAVRPRLILFMRDDFNYSDQEVTTMKQNAAATWLFAREDSLLRQQLQASAENVLHQPLPKPYQQFGLYQLATTDQELSEVQEGF